jgi:hypothetical protein
MVNGRTVSYRFYNLGMAWLGEAQVGSPTKSFGYQGNSSSQGLFADYDSRLKNASVLTFQEASSTVWLDNNQNKIDAQPEKKQKKPAISYGRTVQQMSMNVRLRGTWYGWQSG